MKPEFSSKLRQCWTGVEKLLVAFALLMPLLRVEADELFKPGIIGNMADDWYEQLTIQALTDTATDFNLASEIGRNKQVEDNYWIGSRESFTRTVTPILYVRLSDRDEFLELPIRFEFARKESTISSQYFVDKRFRNGIPLEHNGVTVRTIYPGSSKTRMVVLLADPSGDSITRGAVLCVYSSKPDVKIKFKSVQIDGKGSATAFLASGLKPGRATLTFSPLELMAKPKFAKDEAFNRNPTVELKYGGAEAPPKVVFEDGKSHLAQLGARFDFALHSGNSRTANLVESLLMHRFTPRQSLHDLIRSAFPDEISDEPLNCVAMLGVYQEKFSYNTVTEEDEIGGAGQE